MARGWQEVSILALAYLGDAVYELWVRTHLLELGEVKVRNLHQSAVNYVRAGTQAQILHRILPELDEIEQQVVMRGRNAKGGRPKNIDIITYRHATAFEALVGYWQLEEKYERMDWGFGKIDEILREMA